MTLLQVDKKAVTQADARALLARSYAQEAPYGTPTHTIHPDEFRNTYHDALSKGWVAGFFKRRAMHGELKDTFAGLINAHAPSLKIAEELLSGPDIISTEDLVERLKNKDSSASSKSIKHPEFPEHANHYPKDEYKAPIANIIIAPSASLTGESVMAMSRRSRIVAPGFAEQWQFRINEHEKAHGAGAGETGAEAMSAIVTRKAFEDCSMLKAAADARVMTSLLLFEHKYINLDYGWAAGEVNDRVVAMSKRTINDISEDQIKDIRFQKFKPLIGSLSKLGHIFRNEVGVEALIYADYEYMAEIGDKLRQDIRLDVVGPHARHIMDRFTLACQRYAIGESAYEDGNADVSDELLESERNFVTISEDGLVPE